MAIFLQYFVIRKTCQFGKNYKNCKILQNLAFFTRRYNSIVLTSVSATVRQRDSVCRCRYADGGAVTVYITLHVCTRGYDTSE